MPIRSQLSPLLPFARRYERLLNPIYNPFTGTSDGKGRTPFVNNQIPQSLLDPTALSVQQTPLPLPNLTGIANNYYASGDYRVYRHKVDAKVNYNVSSKFTVSARLGVFDYTGFNPALFGDNGGPVNSAGGRSGNLDGTVFNGTLSGTYTVNSHFIVDSYFGYTGLDASAQDANIGTGNLGLTLFNIPGTNGPTHNYGGCPTLK